MLKGVLLGTLVTGLLLASCKKEEPTEVDDTPMAVETAAPTPAATIAAEEPEEEAEAAERAAAEEKPESEDEDEAVEEPARSRTEKKSGTASAEGSGGATNNEARPSAAKVTRKPAGDAHIAIQRCCNSLVREAKVDAKNKNRLTAASAVCAGLAQQIKEGKADVSAVRTTLRAQLQGMPIPDGC